MVSKQLTKEFRLALSEELGIELKDKEASEMLNNLVGYFRLLTDIDQRKVKSIKNSDA